MARLLYHYYMSIPRPTTQNAGADLERQAIRNIVRRLRARCASGVVLLGAVEALDVVIRKLDTRAVRVNRRKGGLGRK